jgi:hypothetical protein
MTRYYGPGDYTWREIFAFFPVTTISGKAIWLKKVYARRFWLDTTQFHMDPIIEYGELFDVMKDP